MGRTSILFVALLLLVVNSGCVRPASDLKEQVLARVNGEPVFLKEFQVNFLQLKGEQDEISQKNPKLVDQLKTRALNEVIIMTLLRQEATKKKLRIAREEVEGGVLPDQSQAHVRPRSAWGGGARTISR